MKINRLAPNVSRAGRYSDRVLQAFARANLPETVSIKAAQGGNPTEILLYDEIGWFGVTAGAFVMLLNSCPAGKVVVRINSPGGDVFDGLAIYTALKNRGNVDTVIDGIAASAASFIALAGDNVSIAEHAFMMIHNASGMVVGEKDDMTQMAAVLAKIDLQLATLYASKTGSTVADMTAAMDAETYYTAAEARAAKLVDTVVAEDDEPDADDPVKPTKPGPASDPAALAALAASRPGIRVEAADWKVGASRDLPLETSGAWDGGAAAERMLHDAGFNSNKPDPEKAKLGFLVYDAAAPKFKGSYKLPFADIFGGELRAVKSGIDAAASRLPDTDIPESVRQDARGVLDAYEKKNSGTGNATTADVVNLRQRRMRARLATND